MVELAGWLAGWRAGWHRVWVKQMFTAIGGVGKRGWGGACSGDAGSLGKALPLGGVLDRVLLQGGQVNEALAAPHALKLRLPRVHALVLGQVLPLLEALIAAGTLEGLLAGVDPPVALQL